jgi:hypothetical protein
MPGWFANREHDGAKLVTQPSHCLIKIARFAHPVHGSVWRCVGQPSPFERSVPSYPSAFGRESRRCRDSVVTHSGR